MMADGALPKILVIITGGTITASDGSERQYNPKGIDEFKVIDEFKAIARGIADIDVRRLFFKGSPDIHSTDLLGLTKLLWSVNGKCIYAGYVILTGTDGISSTSFWIDCTTNMQEPIVFASAVRTWNAMSSDGRITFRQCIVVAISRQARGRGALVVHNSRIMAARFIVKTSTVSVDPFNKIRLGLVHDMDTTPIFHYPPSRPIGQPYFDVTKLEPEDVPRVSILCGHLDLETELAGFCLELGVRGIVLEGMGAGSWTTRGGLRIQNLRNKTGLFPVVSSFSAETGYVPDVSIYGAPPGVIGSRDLDSPKARILLQLSLATGQDLEETRRTFQALATGKATEGYWLPRAKL